LIDHLEDLLFLSLIRFVANEGGLILFTSFLLSTIFILALVPFLSLFLLLLWFFLLIFDELREDFVMPMPISVGGGSMNEGGSLIPFQFLAVDAFGLGLLPHCVVLEGEEAFLQLLFGEVERTDLGLALGLVLLVGIGVVLLRMLHHLFYCRSNYLKFIYLTLPSQWFLLCYG
jgi:hypothetical protein